MQPPHPVPLFQNLCINLLCSTCPSHGPASHPACPSHPSTHSSSHLAVYVCFVLPHTLPAPQPHPSTRPLSPPHLGSTWMATRWTVTWLCAAASAPMALSPTTGPPLSECLARSPAEGVDGTQHMVCGVTHHRGVPIVASGQWTAQHCTCTTSCIWIVGPHNVGVHVCLLGTLSGVITDMHSCLSVYLQALLQRDRLQLPLHPVAHQAGRTAGPGCEELPGRGGGLTRGTVCTPVLARLAYS
jgi:hypothetical protein